MNLTGIAISYNRVTYILLFAVIILGLAGYNGLPRDSMPPFTVRTATVVTNFPGASPERVEALITDKIEEKAQEIPEVDFISSESRTGLSVVSVALKENVPQSKLQPIWDRLRRKLEEIEGDLPSGISGPTLKDEDVGVVYGIIVGLVNDGFENFEVKDYADELRDRIIRLDDASKVEIGGVVEERIYIDFDNTKLAEIGLSSSQLQNIISSTNIIIPAGEINLQDERVILEPSGNFESIEEIKRTLIPAGDNNKAVYLGEITNIYKDYVSPPKSLVSINGQDAQALYISLKEGANIIQLGQEVDRVIGEYNQELPVGIEAIRMASQDFEVEKSVNDFINNLLQSVVIVLVVMFLFLGLRTGIVVASLIPTAIILAIFLMNQFNIGLNQVSLAALIMALGMMVDNAIVMAESMMVKMENGEKALDAAISASKELMVPLLTSSLTTSAAFLSFFLAESVMGEMMGQLFSVITLTLLSSWLMALTIVPMLAVALIRVKKKEDQKPGLFDRLNVYYQRLINWSLKHPILVIGSILAMLLLSFWGFGKVPFVFMPDSERNLITLDFNLPLGTKIETTQDRMEMIGEFIQDSLLVGKGRSQGVIDYSSFVGEGPNSYDLGYFPGEANSGYGHMLINTSSGDDNQLVIDRLEDFCFERLPNAETVIKRLGSGGGPSIPIEVRISGSDPYELSLIAGKVKEKLISIAGTKRVDDNWGPRIKKFLVNIDPVKLNQSGMTNQDIAVSASTTLSGFEVGEFREDDKSIPIVMRTEGSEQIAFDKLEGLSIFSQNSGSNVPLAQVANIEVNWQYAKILRYDLNRTVTVESQLEEGVTAREVTQQLTSWLDTEKKNWPSGYDYELGGESESSGKAMVAVIEQLPISLIIILLLLVLQFNSIRKTTIILASIPLGIIGVVGGLLLTGTNFSFTGFLGIISLAGIVINNAIVLIDRIQIELTEFKRETRDAILHAATERFRPILLTTFTTSLGLIPLWVGGGVMWQPLAVSIIFGLLFATVITLIFVPVLYKLLFK